MPLLSGKFGSTSKLRMQKEIICLSLNKRTFVDSVLKPIYSWLAMTYALTRSSLMTLVNAFEAIKVFYERLEIFSHQSLRFFV